MNAKILLTGGGSAGHVTPNLALIERLTREGWSCCYVGTANGIERDIIGRTGIPYFPIASGKLRRYFDWKNFTDPFRILLAVFQSLWICLRQRPAVVFSKGGFVAVPVVVAAWLCRIPVICHESDMTPGLANKLCLPFCDVMCVNFVQTLRFLNSPKARLTGSPVREGLLTGSSQAARTRYGLSEELPVLLVFGGSLGASRINSAVREALDTLLTFCQVVHVAGAGNLDERLTGRTGYVQLDYVHEGFGDLLALADVAVARAGANSLYELAATRTPHLLIPLSAGASRGDQLVNARIFREAGFSQVLEEADLSGESLLAEVRHLLAEREAFVTRLASFDVPDAVGDICQMLTERAAD